jgi:two-component system, NarL family, nitrate/nitrite response regulator NarL
MNILIIDDHPLTCQGLSALLMATQPQAQVRSAHTAALAQAALQRLPAPDWIFLDINLPDDTQYQFFHQLSTTHWIDRTILISADPQHHLIRTALAAGARGFIPKTAEPDLVTQGFASILAGEFYLPPAMAEKLRQHRTDGAGARPLSPRLLQVQEQLLHGASNKLIARELNLSAHTVKQYVSSVLAYHGVTSRLALVLKNSR